MSTLRLAIPSSLTLFALPMAFLLSGCPEKTPSTLREAGKDPYAKGAASQPSAEPGAASQPDAKKQAKKEKAAKHVGYIKDGDDVPQRKGVTRIFMQQASIKYIRDLAVDPVSGDIVAAARRGGVDGLWRIPKDGAKESVQIAVKPLRDSKGKESAKNRSNWFFSTPRVLPSGEHVLFGGASASPTQRYANTFGIVPMKSGMISAVVVKDVKYAVTPDVHPDGKTVVFATCDEIRTTRINGTGDQEIESLVVTRIQRSKNASNPAVCTVFRPKFSPDGKRIVFEGIGAHFSEAEAKRFEHPKRQNAADFFIEPYVVDANGKNLHKLVQNDGWNDVGGRVKAGGAHHPIFSRDNSEIIFAHGKAIAHVALDGKQVSMMTHSAVIGGSGGTRFSDEYPVISKDGQHIYAVSKLIGGESPIGVAIIDPTAVDPRTPQEQAKDAAKDGEKLKMGPGGDDKGMTQP
ncbi:MAG: hypothetical protein GY822_16460 [Deltaproteobacteria bacterium]|nr:hypothetical protein [Deltaproteobacteria bacterium]